MPFDIWVDGNDRPRALFSEPQLINFRTRSDALHICFHFPTKYSIPAPWASELLFTELAIEPKWLAKALAVMVRTGVSRLLAFEGIRHAIARRHHDRPSSIGARFALRVDVSRSGCIRRATLLGRGQAGAAAVGAAGVARLLIEGDVAEAGAWMPEQIVDPSLFLSRLAAQGLRVEFSDELQLM